MFKLKSDGFELVKGAAPFDEFAPLRDRISGVLRNLVAQPGDKVGQAGLGTIMINPAQREPELFAALLRSPALWDGLREALRTRSVTFLPETAFHSNGYGDWHKDTGAQEKAGHYFHWTPYYGVFTVALYFQENTPLHAGGLDVIPGSHQIKKAFTPGSGPVPLSVPSALGDAVVFDMRIDHKASWPAEKDLKPEKIAAYFSVCAPHSGGDLYLRFLRSRPDYTYLRDFAYPEELLQVLADNGIKRMQ
ncbi:MAG: hypothetical protein EBS23_02910 [Betaproteobacteria bacterium]|nr:hypothetical protein [Betaproteobacteria bacterium]